MHFVLIFEYFSLLVNGLPRVPICLADSLQKLTKVTDWRPNWDRFTRMMPLHKIMLPVFDAGAVV